MSGTAGAPGTLTTTAPFSTAASVGFDLCRGLGGGASRREVGGTESETVLLSTGRAPSAETMVGELGVVMRGTLSGGTLIEVVAAI